jgi:hypothetical protein
MATIPAPAPVDQTPIWHVLSDKGVARGRPAPSRSPHAAGARRRGHGDTQLEAQLRSQPPQVKEEILAINDHARQCGLQVALLVPILNGKHCSDSAQSGNPVRPPG